MRHPQFVCGFLRTKYNEKYLTLLKLIREKHQLTMGQACLLLGVSPWTVRYSYAPVILEMAQDIGFDGRVFAVREPSLELKTSTSKETKLETFVAKSIIHPLKGDPQSVKHARPPESHTT